MMTKRTPQSRAAAAALKVDRGSAAVHTARTTRSCADVNNENPGGGQDAGSVDDAGSPRLKGAARNMSSSRSSFLKGLRARLQSDIALREAERDEESPGTGLEPVEEPAVEQEPRPPQNAAAASRAAQVEPWRDAAPEDATPARPLQASDRAAPVGLTRDREEDLSADPSASWAEAGMPLRLRDAIASVRRVSYELYQGAPPDHEPLPVTPRPGHGDDDDFLSEIEPASDSTWDDGAAEPDHDPADRDDPWQADRMDGPTDEIVFHPHAPGDEWPSANNGLQEQFERAFQHEQIELEDGAAPEELGLGNGGVRKRDEAARTLYDGAAYQERTRGDATHEEPRSDDDDADEEPSPGLEEELNDPPPARRRPTAGYGVHVTALAAAVVFVALAGFGFGMLSDSAPPDGSTPVQDMATAAPEPPPAASETPPPLDEVATVRVAPPPGDALAEPASVAPTRTAAPTSAADPLRAIPLPPPPKPDLPQAATDQAPRDNQLGDATADAAIVPAGAAEPVEQAVSAPPEGEGTGGPFEPLFAKAPSAQASGGQVLVQYMTDAAGGPATAMHLVRQLKAAGFAVEARGVPFSIRANSIRYFFPEDRDRAEALRASLERQLPRDAAPAVMDFSSFKPKPQEGHLEVWLRS
jgi:hypothetical protein